MSNVSLNVDESNKIEMYPNAKKFIKNCFKVINRDKYLVILCLPAIIITLIFQYIPMYGVLIAFQNYAPHKGFFHSDWVGFQHFEFFLASPYFWRVLKNTFLLSVYGLTWGFPPSIILALLLNEITNSKFKRLTQTITYFPHFISTVIIVGLIYQIFSFRGPVNALLVLLGQQKIQFLTEASWFRTIYIGTGVWQGLGWGSIIYLAAIAGVNPELYESAIIDGANRFHRMRHITLPTIMPTIVILLLLRMPHLLGGDMVRVLLMQNPLNYSTSEIIPTYTYRVGLQEAQFSFASAVGMFMLVFNLFFTYITNRISKKVSEISLW